MNKQEFVEKLKSGHVLYKNGIALIVAGFFKDGKEELVIYKYLVKVTNGDLEDYKFEYETETLEDSFKRFDEDSDFLIKPFIAEKNGK